MDTNELVRKSFIDGYTKGRKDIINKACEWLKDNLFVHTQDEEEVEIEWDPSITTNLIVCDYFNSIDDCINDFIKTLEL